MTNLIIVTTENLEEEIKDIRALEAKLTELKELKEEKEAKVKKVLDDAGVEELKVGAFTVRFQNVVRNNFNTTAFYYVVFFISFISFILDIA